jgi:hypothetical protein
MRLSSLWRVTVVGVAALGSTLLIPAAGQADPTAVLYATPAPVAGADCSSLAPCGIVTATTTAPAGSEVVIEPGSYGSSSARIAVPLGSGAADVDYHGVAGEAMPVVFTSSSFNFQGSSLTWLHVDAAGSPAALAGTTASHVIAVATAASSAACELDGSIADSACIDTGTNGRAVSYDGSAETPTAVAAAVRGVTAVATGSGGTGLLVEAGNDVTLDVLATNDIFQGGTDIESEATTATSHAALAIDHSDFASAANPTPPAGGSAAITPGTGNLSAPPTFAAAGIGDFREAAGSPTIDAGALDPNDSTDVLGDPRKLGSAPDMGAAEFLVAPRIHGLHLVDVAAHHASFVVTVNAEGFSTFARLLVHHKKDRETGRSLPAGTSSHPVTLTMTISGLARHTRYDVDAIASNRIGTTTTAVKTFTTH